MNAATYVAGTRVARHASTTLAHPSDTLTLRFNQGMALLLLILLSPAMAILTFLVWKRDDALVLFAHCVDTRSPWLDLILRKTVKVVGAR
jgi:hypothetical protein